MPRLKRAAHASPGLMEFLATTKSVDGLRNFVQHMNQEIGKRRRKLGPVWGVLEWSWQEKAGAGTICWLAAGRVVDDVVMMAPPLDKSARVPIDFVRLSCAGSATWLSEGVEASFRIARRFEESLAQQFGSHPRIDSDRLILMKWKGVAHPSTESQGSGDTTNPGEK